MKRLILIPISLLLTSLLTTTSHATSNDYVVLESIRAVNSTVTLEDDLVYELTVSAPSAFSWSPTDSNFDGFLTILLCAEDIKNELTTPISCDYSGKMSQYRISTIGNISETDLGLFTQYTFTVSGIPIINRTGTFFPYMIRIPRTDISDPDNYSLFYYFGRDNVLDTFNNIINVQTISFENSYIEVLVELPTPEPEPTVEPVQDPAPVPTQQPIVNNPAPRASVATPSVAAPQVIQSNFYLPTIAGDSNWKPMQQIKGRFDGWKRLKKNAINNGRNQVTKTNGAMITFRSEGDALSLRFLGGKKRGSFSIYVNGELLDRVDAKRKKKRALIKAWEGLGEGNHFIDVVAELTPGESIAINGVHSPRG